MIVIDMLGRLGNQMFIYALYQALVMQGKDVKLDLSHNRLDSKSRQERAGFAIEPNLDLFQLDYQVLDNETALEMRKESSRQDLAIRFKRKFAPGKCQYHYEKDSATFDSLVFKVDNIYLDGYWQSEKYFKHITPTIREIFTFPDLLTDYQRTMCEQIQRVNSVCVHVRRGDFLNYPEIYGNTDLEYYRRSMKYISERVENVHFFMFSNDIDWVKQNITGTNITYIDSSDDIVTGNMDMVLMMKCRHNIIANSSFSWWGAWLGEQKNKIVVAPAKWEMQAATPDIWCDNWIKM